MKNVLNLLTTIIRTDSYKLSQWMQYPADTTHISSYIESRGGEDTSVFFGLQAFIKEYMLTPITQADVDRAEKIVLAHGLPFNREGWEIIVNEYGGRLPLEIEAVPEGTVMPTHNVQVQIVNTDPRLFWLTSYVETAMLRGIWYPSTVATKSRKMKRFISAALEKSSDVPVAEQINFKLHDFGARGASSSETAMLGGMAHLVNFMGTDTVEALIGAMEYYNTDAVPGFSIPASEHSTITSWGGPEGEVLAFENMIDKFAGPGKLYACVSDSYDIYNAARHLWGEVLKDKIVRAGGTLVVRPDSGDPETVPVEVVGLLMEAFGYTINSKGYKVLPPHIRLIQGDGINETSLPKILDNMLAAGYSIDNIAFGMGGGLLQAWNRDTLKYAMKASARRDTAGVWHDVFKDPVSDRGKTSKRGRLGLVYECGLGNCGFHTVPKEIADKKGNVLEVVYRDGVLLKETTFEEVRGRAAMKESEYVTPVFERY